MPSPRLKGSATVSRKLYGERHNRMFFRAACFSLRGHPDDGGAGESWRALPALLTSAWR